MSVANDSTGTATTAIAESPTPDPGAHARAPVRYRGRFAPSPTGLLHFGSLVAAVASFLDARASSGDWLVRIEDLDQLREVPGSADHILRTLEAFGFEWTGPVLKQSERRSVYEAALERLSLRDLVYFCSCSRKNVAATAGSLGLRCDEPRYPGSCRNGPLNPSGPCALRFKVERGVIAFEDAIQGRIAIDVRQDCGDFIVKRRDGVFAYQLAVVVDDGEQGITHIVRGADLVTSTPRQLLLQRALRLPRTNYAHIPLATDSAGFKLSKSAGAGAVDFARPELELFRALQFLRQSPPTELRTTDLRTIWGWAVQRWTTAALRDLKQAAPKTS